jgi:hypothetical protein
MMAMIGKMKTIGSKANPSAPVTTLLIYAAEYIKAKTTIEDSKLSNEIVEHVGGW